MARILSISSQVVRGRVGNSIAVPALESMGHEVWQVPTILLSVRPGLGTIVKQQMPAELVSEFLVSYAADGLLGSIDGILSGYLPSAAHVQGTAQAVEAVKAANPKAFYLCDPVMGDGDKGLYIAQSAAESIRDDLLDHADLITPNLFELRWLSASPDGEPASLAAGLAPEMAAVTSSLEGEEIENILCGPDFISIWRGKRLQDIPNGTGDLFAALLLGHILGGQDPERAFLTTCGQLEVVAERSSGRDILHPLPLPERVRMGETVCGVDGCPAGWIAVLWSGGDTAEAHLCHSFEDVLKLEAKVIAVDMPIGLPELAGIGGRICETQTRSRLGDRQSSVFAVPSRAAAMEEDYRRACTVNLEHSDPPRKVSKQCFNLFPKIREIDTLITPELQSRVYEVHPELAFWALNGEQPVSLAKKVKSRPSPDGLELRRKLLTDAGFPIGFIDELDFPRSKVGSDDILDACACAWSAMRISRGEHITLPPEPMYDGKGLRMEINA